MSSIQANGVVHTTPTRTQPTAAVARLLLTSLLLLLLCPSQVLSQSCTGSPPSYSQGIDLSLGLFPCGNLYYPVMVGSSCSAGCSSSLGYTGATAYFICSNGQWGGGPSCTKSSVSSGNAKCDAPPTSQVANLFYGTRPCYYQNYPMISGDTCTASCSSTGYSNAPTVIYTCVNGK